MNTKRYTLSQNQQKELVLCHHVKKVSDRTVQYTADFKRHALSERARGKPPRQIWSEAGIPYYFDKDYSSDRIKDWRRVVQKYGNTHFDQENRGKAGNAGLLRSMDEKRAYKTMTDTEKIVYLEARQEALEYIARHFQLPPSIHHNSRRRKK